ncbi:cell division protein ZapE [Aquamicrobium sp. LC103]|uniref:cell division protein ZapE n=1 Tax=Aquamicrobium sp. LC103 TaxID=1120658 RepID=UPI00063E892B|nr:cell division protein ZapE [Aquamicrobium sp. LC103]TKT82825.1 AFG1 family ATPase [Aquamicrobium sp. LC103]
MSPHDGLSTFRSVRQKYENLVATAQIASDASQLAVADALDRLIAEIATKRLEAKSSSLGWLFARRRPRRELVKGLYVHGDVGRGKTMLMDMFFELVPVRRKRRAHFNDFMADVHDRIQKHRQALKDGKTRETDPIPPVAKALAEEAWVLCFDEFTVTDIADAMVLSRLFSGLFDQGVVLVATSNVMPRDLYRDGLNRGLFEPFIAILENHASIMSLDGDTDYRREKLNRLPVYITPLGSEADRLMDEAWAVATSGHEAHPMTLTVKGRSVAVPLANGRAARFGFSDLCERPLAARDYLAVAARFDTVFIDRVPVLGAEKRNEAKRFILLIDTFYDNHIHLVMSAEAAPEKLYAGRIGTEAFEFERTASRLTEMQSREWLETSRARIAAE